MTEAEVLEKLSEYKDAILSLKAQVKSLEEEKAILTKELEDYKLKDQNSSSQIEKDAADKEAFLAQLAKITAEADEVLKS